MMRGLFGATPTSAIPHPARSTPSGMRAGRGVLSEKMPNRGCTIDELTVAAKTSAPAAAREIFRPEIRKGSSAATAPWFRSVNRCPAESTIIARRSTPFLLLSLNTGSLSNCGRRKKILSVFYDLVGCERHVAAGAKFRERLPHLPHRFHSALGGLPGRRTSSAGRSDLRQHPRHVLLYAAELPGLAQRLPEAANLVDETEIQRLRACPHPPSGDAFEVEKVHTAPPRDTVLELGVDAPDLPFDHPQFVGVGPAAQIEKTGARPPLQRDGIDAEFLVEPGGEGPNGEYANGTGERGAACDDVARRRRDVVAARGGSVPHKDDNRFFGIDAFDLVPDKIRSQRVAAGRVDVEYKGGDSPAVLRHPERGDYGVAPGLLPADEGQREGQSPAPPPNYGPQERDERDLLSRAPPVRHAQ